MPSLVWLNTWWFVPVGHAVRRHEAVFRVLVCLLIMRYDGDAILRRNNGKNCMMPSNPIEEARIDEVSSEIGQEGPRRRSNTATQRVARSCAALRETMGQERPWEASTKAFVAHVLAERQESHGYGHACIVFDTAMQLVTQIERNDATPFDQAVAACWGLQEVVEAIVGMAALVHDVCDHKFVHEGMHDTLKGQLDVQLAKGAHMALIAAGVATSDVDERVATVVQYVDTIVRNVSYSKEKRGELEQMDSGVLYMRNVVSDADKLDAIGIKGVERCRLYACEVAERNAPSTPLDEDAIMQEVLTHMDEKLLLLKDKYIRTAAGQRMAEQPHADMVAWYRTEKDRLASSAA